MYGGVDGELTASSRTRNGCYKDFCDIFEAVTLKKIQFTMQDPTHLNHLVSVRKSGRTRPSGQTL